MISDNETIELVESLPFEVHASILTQLGEQMITDDVMAIAELVKNSYDADASLVKIAIDTKGKFRGLDNRVRTGEITIEDNGSGMDLGTVKSGWLTISNSMKRIMKQTGKLTDKERIPLGDKGVGRLSSQRLGECLTMTTKRRGDHQELIIFIDWNKFRGDITLSEVKVELKRHKVSPLESQRSYTKIVVQGLKNINDWKHSDNVDKFEAKLSKIISPFDFNRSFYVQARVDNRRMELPQVSKQLLELATATYNISVSGEFLVIKGLYREELFPAKPVTDRLREFISFVGLEKVRAQNTQYLEDGAHVLEYSEKIELTSLGGISLQNHCGPFEMRLYDYMLDSERWTNIKAEVSNVTSFESLSELRNHVKNYAGVKIFRDQFSIFPYGETDWLKFSVGSTSGASMYVLRPNNVVGYVTLTGKNNSKLKEKTDREGFVDDEFSRFFFGVCFHAIKRINQNRTFLRRQFIDYQKYVEELIMAQVNKLPNYEEAKAQICRTADQAKTMAETYREARASVEKIATEINITKNSIANNKINKQEQDRIAEMYNKIEEAYRRIINLLTHVESGMRKIEEIRASAIVLAAEINRTMEQSQGIVELAGLGLTAEGLTHEIYTVINNIKTDGQNLRRKLKNQGFYSISIDSSLDSIIDRADALRKQVNHLAPGFRAVRMKKEEISINNFISDLFAFYEGRAKREGIILKHIRNDKDSMIYANKGMLTQVFDNLYNNAEYWLEQSYDNNLIRDKRIYVETFKNGLIVLWDNGMGVDPNIEDQIFEPFVSNKEEGAGRGLGLYIVRRLLGINNSNIRLLETQNQFGKKYKFAIDLSKALVKE